MSKQIKGLLFVAFVQLGFSALDTWARLGLREHSSLLDALLQPWLPVWLVGQVALVPFQIRLITSQGLGRGVALMNAFSVLYACIFTVFIANEHLRVVDWIAAGLVCAAVICMMFRSKKVDAHATTYAVLQVDEPIAETFRSGRD